MKRVVQPEMLDSLPPDEALAVRSRHDLRRVNTVMGNDAILSRALRDSMNGNQPGNIVDLGAGDGCLLLRVARRFAGSWQNVNATLLDRHAAAGPQTLTAFAKLGWRADVVRLDVFEWTRSPASKPAACIVTNLFLHHFVETQLVELLGAVATRAHLFVAVEPRRGSWSLSCARLLGVIGCNAVTRHDAVVSVRAGFSGRELSALWPAAGGWRLTERPAGLFSHLFVAQKTG
jgi:hypothetical protein